MRIPSAPGSHASHPRVMSLIITQFLVDFDPVNFLHPRRNLGMPSDPYMHFATLAIWHTHLVQRRPATHQTTYQLQHFRHDRHLSESPVQSQERRERYFRAGQVTLDDQAEPSNRSPSHKVSQVTRLLGKRIEVRVSGRSAGLAEPQPGGAAPPRAYSTEEKARTRAAMCGADLCDAVVCRLREVVVHTIIPNESFTRQPGALQPFPKVKISYSYVSFVDIGTCPQGTAELAGEIMTGLNNPT